MQEYRIADPMTLREAFIGSIGREGMLICAAASDGAPNPMTATWGGVGFMWGRPVFWCAVRQCRYTYTLLETQDAVSLSFYGEAGRAALAYCGTHSGRDTNKVRGAGLTPMRDGDFFFFEGARLVLEGRKLYADTLRPEGFCDARIPSDSYSQGEYHKLYFCEVQKVLVAR